jgi:hypothetical protein
MTRRILVACFILGLAAGLLFGGFHEWTARAASTTCANSFPADGHGGPWRTQNNGGTLHGNSLHVDCPSGSTHWHFIYRVQGQIGGVWVNEISEERSGNGSLDTSFALSPYQCDQGHLYRTHVDNVVTGGTINKPSGGSGVQIGC